MFTALVSRLKGYFAVAIGSLIFLTFAWLRARQDGRNAAELAAERRQAEAARKRKESDDEVDRMDSDKRRADLQRWLRNE